MRVVEPVTARKGEFIDSFGDYKQACRVGERLERILRNTGAKGEIVLTTITSAKGAAGIGAPKMSFQLFWLK